MMQAPDFGDWRNPPELRRLDRPLVRRAYGEGEVGPRVVVVGEILTCA
jgi:hypothetical protein